MTTIYTPTSALNVYTFFRLVFVSCCLLVGRYGTYVVNTIPPLLTPPHTKQPAASSSSRERCSSSQQQQQQPTTQHNIRETAVPLIIRRTKRLKCIKKHVQKCIVMVIKTLREIRDATQTISCITKRVCIWGGTSLPWY